MVQLPRSARLEAMGCTKAYCPLLTYRVSGSKCAAITIKFADYNNIYYLCALYGYETTDIRGDGDGCAADKRVQQG